MKVGGLLFLSQTALDVFSLMEDSGLLSRERLDILQTILKKCDLQLSKALQKYINGTHYTHTLTHTLTARRQCLVTAEQLICLVSAGGYASQPPSIREAISDQDRPPSSMENLVYVCVCVCVCP